MKRAMGFPTEFGNTKKRVLGFRTLFGNTKKRSLGFRTEFGRTKKRGLGFRTEFGSTKTRSLGFRTEFGSTKTRVVGFRTKKRCDFSRKGMGLFGYCKPDSVAKPVGVEGGNGEPTSISVAEHELSHGTSHFGCFLKAAGGASGSLPHRPKSPAVAIFFPAVKKKFPAVPLTISCRGNFFFVP